MQGCSDSVEIRGASLSTPQYIQQSEFECTHNKHSRREADAALGTSRANSNKAIRGWNRLRAAFTAVISDTPISAVFIKRKETQNQRKASLMPAFDDKRMSLENKTDNDGTPIHEDSEPASWRHLRLLCTINMEHFALQRDKKNVRIKRALQGLLHSLDGLGGVYWEVSRIAPLFDFDENTPGNGYRSFLALVDKCIIKAGAACKDMLKQKDSVLFRKTYHMKEIEAYSRMLDSLGTCLSFMKTMFSWRETTEEGYNSLFHSEDFDPHELLNEAMSTHRNCFYGRGLGFQFCDDLKNILRVLMISMASFSEVFYDNKTLSRRCLNSLQYVVNPEARARRILDVTNNADISFCQTFWNLTEHDLVASLPQLVMPNLAINQLISIPPEEMDYTTLNGSTIKIPIPNSHIRSRSIPARLLSSKRRKGMIGSGSSKGRLPEQCDALMIHCHGGGFVAHSSRVHESYLRTWTNELDIPILSIDYSLAPEAPYPRAVEEILYAYVWALKHANTLLGSAARKIVFAGDSAGANLMLVTAIRCLELDIQPPDGIFLAYASVLVDLHLTPSRFLCLADPILPFGILLRCLRAYIVTKPREKDTSDDELAKRQFDKSNTSLLAEMKENDIIASGPKFALDDNQNSRKLRTLASNSTINSDNLTDTDVEPDIKKNSRLGSSVPRLSDANGESRNRRNAKSWPFFSRKLKKNKKPKSTKNLETNNGRLDTTQFRFAIPKDYYLSPCRAPIDLLKRLPPIKILTTHVDPLLDECVVFAKKLKALEKPVTLDILNGLPHGFLNLVAVSKEANEASHLCAKKIRELLET